MTLPPARSLPAAPRVGIFYSAACEGTGAAAHDLADALFSLTGLSLTLAELTRTAPADLAHYDALLLGCPTCGGELPADWAAAFPAFQELDLAGRAVGLFGCDDQRASPRTFQDALGILAEAAQVSGARLVGSTAVAGYDFSDSRAVFRGRFIGLALDPATQPDLSGDRVRRWVAGLAHELGWPIRPGA